MRTGMVLLCLAYVLSQFFRSFLAVLSTVLAEDLGATPQELATASGMWFLSFALMQLPVGWALDRIGPRRTASALLLIGGGGGAVMFALATGTVGINIAMLLIGVGCSPVLMASYYIFARQFPPARFATLAALMLGVGSVGNLGASYPMALAADLIGWRMAMLAMGAVSIAVAVGVFVTVRDPGRVETDTPGSLLDLLRMPILWTIFPLMFVNYAPSGAIRGLWIGPYMNDVFGLNTTQVGQATLFMGVFMILGTFAYGPLDRLLGTRKWVVFWGNLICALSLLALAMLIDHGVWLALGLIAVLAVTSASYPVIIAHGRSFFPPHMVGRGVTLMNLFGIGGVGLMQMISGRVHGAMSGGDPATPYVAIFGFFAVSLLVGTLIYLFTRDSVD